MKTAIWFSRHVPSPSQLVGIEALGYALVAVELGRHLGAINLDAESLPLVEGRLIDMSEAHGAKALFGVFTPPIQEWIARGGCGMACYAAWNCQRCVEGGPATFEHHAWCWVGGTPDRS